MNAYLLVFHVCASCLLTGCLTSTELPHTHEHEQASAAVTEPWLPPPSGNMDLWPIGTEHSWDISQVQNLTPLLIKRQRDGSSSCYSQTQWGLSPQGWLKSSAEWPTPNALVHVWVNQGQLSTAGSWLLNAQPCLQYDSGQLRWFWKNAEDDTMPAVGWNTWFQVMDIGLQPHADADALWGSSGTWTEGSQALSLQITARDEAYVMNQQPPYFRSLQEFLNSPRTCWQSLCWRFSDWQADGVTADQKEAALLLEWVNAQDQVLRSESALAIQREVAGATVVHVENIPEWVPALSEAWKTPIGTQPAWAQLNGQLWSGYHWPSRQVTSPFPTLYNSTALSSLAHTRQWSSTP